jgi:hypothetical protein
MVHNDGTTDAQLSTRLTEKKREKEDVMTDNGNFTPLNACEGTAWYHITNMKGC